MKAILEKLSAYNIFSYLLPGLLFVSLGERTHFVFTYPKELDRWNRSILFYWIDH